MQKVQKRMLIGGVVGLAVLGSLVWFYSPLSWRTAEWTGKVQYHRLECASMPTEAEQQAWLEANQAWQSTILNHAESIELVDDGRCTGQTAIQVSYQGDEAYEMIKRLDFPPADIYTMPINYRQI